MNSGSTFALRRASSSSSSAAIERLGDEAAAEVAEAARAGRSGFGRQDRSCGVAPAAMSSDAARRGSLPRTSASPTSTASAPARA